MECPFCPPTLREIQIIAENKLCRLIVNPDRVLVGSLMIIPKAHRETAFDLTPTEWLDTFGLLQEAKALLDRDLAPQGYNLGWNCGEVGGQEILHAHLHVIPRFHDEPFAGRGIRFWLKQDENRRSS